jgi:L-aminopeptidase/D-esterase-like protein
VTAPAPQDGATLPVGVTAGHWTDGNGLTGCTVVLTPGGAVAGVDVRGGAPGTLGTDALRPGTLVERAHAVLLTGGSAFGLHAADGVMRYLEAQGAGFGIGPVRVPIVAGAVIFDLMAGDPRARPDAAAGYAACEAATSTPASGRVGAGAGATVAKAGRAPAQPGGLGIASASAGDVHVAAIMVANSVGGIWDDERHEWIAPVIRGTPMEPGAPVDPASAAGVSAQPPAGPVPGANTTIGVVVTDATLTREQANRVATVAHDGIARAVRPAHTRFDGDTMFCLATGIVPAGEGIADQIESIAADLVARAIADGVGRAVADAAAAG